MISNITYALWKIEVEGFRKIEYLYNATTLAIQTSYKCNFFAFAYRIFSLLARSCLSMFLI